METEAKNIITVGVRIAWFILVLICLSLYGCPAYKVYERTKEGEAELKQAESNRQIKILEAEATKKSASDLAAADTIRAHGVARSNEIIGSSLRDNEAYLHWLWIDNLEKNQQAVIYVPTEANLPIMEAGRMAKRKE